MRGVKCWDSDRVRVKAFGAALAANGDDQTALFPRPTSLLHLPFQNTQFSSPFNFHKDVTVSAKKVAWKACLYYFSCHSLL